MANMIEKTGLTVDEAIQAAVEELGVTKDDLEIEILELPTKKLFGLFGGTPAKIRATLKVYTTPVEETAPETVKEPNEDPIKESVEKSVTKSDEESAEESIKAPFKEAVKESVKALVENVIVKPIEKIADKEPAEEIIEPILEPSPVDEKSDTEALDKAKTFLRDVFNAIELNIEIEVTEIEGGYLFNLSGKGLGVLIGRHGQALDSLQYLLNLAANRHDAEEKIHFVIDVEGYRERRSETLEKLAQSMAERAVKTRRDVRLEPMNRHERKVIHTALQDNNRVETHSAGTEPYRYVIITPKRGKR